MAIRGRLSEAGLPNVLQLLAMGRKTGCLSLSSAGAFGYVYFSEGWIIHASVVNRSLASDEAVYELFTWPEGTFNFEPGVEPDPSLQCVNIDPQGVMLEAARRLDEWSVIAKKIPSLDMVFAIDRQKLIAARYTLTAEQEALLPLIDGHRDVEALIEAAQLGQFETGKALYGLITAEFLVPVGAHPAPPRGRTTRVEEHRNLGIAFYRVGMLPEALRELRRALELDNSDAGAAFYAGLIALRRAEWSVGVAAMKRAAELAPGSIAPFVNAAVAFERLERYDDARRTLDMAAVLGGNDEMLRINASALALRSGATVAARTHLDLARQGMGDRRPSAPWYHYMAVLAVHEGDLMRAASVLADGVADHPTAAALLNNLAAIRLALGDTEGARTAAERGLVEDPSLPELRYNLSLLTDRGSRSRSHNRLRTTS